MNILHDISKERINPEDFIVVVEISKGSKKKYELDKETGLIILDRILYTSTHYPHNYGFIPLTHTSDNDPLDALVICSEELEPLSMVRCYPIGVVKMIDNEEEDNKIIAIPFKDPAWNSYKDIGELPDHLLKEISHFFEVYKNLEHKVVTIKTVLDAKAAALIVKESIEEYKALNKAKRKN